MPITTPEQLALAKRVLHQIKGRPMGWPYVGRGVLTPKGIQTPDVYARKALGLTQAEARRLFFELQEDNSEAVAELQRLINEAVGRIGAAS
jgi:hypothetical protein